MDKKSILLKELAKGRCNNFDFLRFIAAIFVIVSHSFPLVYGDNKKELFYIFTHGQLTFGNLAVKVFFIISGFLIARSWDNTNNIFQFMKARILRIFPGIITVVAISTFILGAIFTTYPLKEYFQNENTYRYLSSITLYHMQYSLPGVFQDNIYQNAVNGSLWTLMHEFNCYILIGILGLLKLLKKQFILPLFLFTFTSYVMKWEFPGLPQLSLKLAVCFFAGTLFFCFKDIIKIRTTYFIISVAVLLLATQFRGFEITSTILLPYIVLYLAFTPHIKLNRFAAGGDLSYGIYIYAFPIQQIITHLFGETIQWYTNLILAIPFVLLFSFLSWHFIEKPFINLKNMGVRDFYENIRNQFHYLNRAH
ncbi:acyltransferase family protein [Anaerocolumna sedimenticola]|uniref:Acyltransferase family protein n=1 Tax=Anaerocolumna sedimenticola TaxID=2696063 RepID=A0A6P1TU47_9FIRM|nr:acyltransferase [Anaerocolumna sedimenticola]QHQ63018.1 acyltransferase family protein [Anaerocolumna sedimenticola]